MSIRLDGDAGAEWRTHWPVVLASMLGVASSTLNTYSTGLFIAPLQQQFGWSRAVISSGGLIVAFFTVLSAPFMGRIVDRLGPRWIGIFGVVGISCSTAMLGLAGPTIGSWWAIWTLIGLINVFLQPMVWTAAIAGYFSAARGAAFAVALCGSGLASLTIPLLSYTLIARLGWRLAFAGLGLACALIVLPVLLLFFTSRTDRGRSVAAVAARPPLAAPGDARRVLLSRRFLTLAAAATLIATVTVSFAVSVVPLLSWNGLARSQAAGIASLLGVAAIAGRLLIGILLDRIDGRVLAAVSVSLPVLTSAILIGVPGSFAASLVATMILGLALGTELDLVAYLASRHFGLERFGLLFGTIGGAITLAGAVGPWIISLVYDRTHSYEAALWAAIPICLCAAILFMSLGPYPAVAGRGDRASTTIAPDTRVRTAR